MLVANTILDQLGGKQFIIMTGSKNFRGNENSLTMNLTRNKLGAKWLTITLEASDTYTMLFQSFSKKSGLVIKAEFDNVYDDMLRSIFEEQTGLS